MEAVVDNEEAEEVSNHKIEDDPNRENGRTSTAPSVLKFDPSADFGTVDTVLRLSTDMPSCGSISG